MLGKIFGTKRAIEKTTDAAISTGDALFFTKEEKANWHERLLALYEPFKVAQRLIALVLTVPFALIHFLCSMVWLYKIASSTIDESIKGSLIELMSVNNNTLLTPVGIVLTFYFLGGAGEGVVKAWKKGVDK